MYRFLQIYHIDKITVKEALDAVSGNIQDSLSGFHGRPGDVGRNDAVGRGEQGVICRANQAKMQILLKKFFTENENFS